MASIPNGYYGIVKPKAKGDSKEKKQSLFSHLASAIFFLREDCCTKTPKIIEQNFHAHKRKTEVL